MQVPSVFSVAWIDLLVLLEHGKGKCAHAGHPTPAPESWHQQVTQVSLRGDGILLSGHGHRP